MFRFSIFSFSLLLLLSSCGDDVPDEEVVEDAACFDFNADTAYAFIKKQVDMGPRIPGTPTQNTCAQWLQSKLKEYTDEVYVQMTKVSVGDKSLPCINVVGSMSPQIENRVLLLAHWDTRPWADKEDKSKKIDGADDGASGVGVLLEIARQLQGKLTNVGVDILLLDVEDYGESGVQDSYCKGAQYWAANPHKEGYHAQYGILLDMVGGKGNMFYEEEYSKAFAQMVINNVWNTAHRLGYGSYFSFNQGYGVLDDHYYINKVAKIPTIDIIGSSAQMDFPAHHHTTADNMDIIDTNTLKAVGQSVLQVICNANQDAPLASK